MLCRSYPWWGLSALQPLDVSLEFLESNKHVHLFCCQVEECCVRCAAYHEVHRLCCTQTWITHGLDESNIPLPPLQINQLSLLSSHWDLLRAAHSCVSPQEHVKGKQGICSGYIAVTPASMWIVVVLATFKQGLKVIPFLPLPEITAHSLQHFLQQSSTNSWLVCGMVRYLWCPCALVWHSLCQWKPRGAVQAFPYCVKKLRGWAALGDVLF